MGHKNGVFKQNFSKFGFGNRMGFKMLGYEVRIIKVDSKPSWKSCRGKTDIRIIFVGYTVSIETLEHA